jgi:hypothetical protein
MHPLLLCTIHNTRARADADHEWMAPILCDVAQIVPQDYSCNLCTTCHLWRYTVRTYSTYLNLAKFHWASPTMEEPENGIVEVDSLGADEKFHPIRFSFQRSGGDHRTFCRHMGECNTFRLFI